MKEYIQAVELSRWYGYIAGLNHISFALEPGITGFVGPNGAGKSTLIQIITGQLRPSSGSLTVFGEVPYNNPPLLARVGFCPERDSVPDYLRPMHWLMGLARLSGIPGNEISERCHRILERVKLPKEHWKKRLKQYSKGMRQRVKLAQALIHEPELLVLDEPMNGLDPMGRQEFSVILKQLAGEGANIIISSHILAELEPLCQQVLIMNWGRVLATGKQESIRQEIQDWSEQLFVRCDDPHKLAYLLFHHQLIRGFDLDEEAKAITLRIRSGETFFDAFPALVRSNGLSIQEMRSQSRSLRNLFDRITR